MQKNVFLSANPPVIMIAARHAELKFNHGAGTFFFWLMNLEFPQGFLCEKGIVHRHRHVVIDQAEVMEVLGPPLPRSLLAWLMFGHIFHML